MNHDYTLVFTFNNMMDAAPGTTVTLTPGTGSVVLPLIFNGNTITVNLTNVANARTTTITLSGAKDECDQTLADTSVKMCVLLGDTTGNSLVNSSDAASIQSLFPASVNLTNFPADVTVDGIIDDSDVALAKLHSGTAHPDVTVTPGDQGLSYCIVGYCGDTSPHIIYLVSTAPTTFKVRVTLSTGAYDSLGLSYWLETNAGLAPYLSISSTASVTYLTFGQGMQTNPLNQPITFDSTTGASSGFLTANRDLGAIVVTSATPPQPPVTSFDVTEIEFAVTAPLCTGSNPPCVPSANYRLRHTRNWPLFPEVTDTSFVDHYIDTTGACCAGITWPVGDSQGELTFSIVSGDPVSVVSRKTHGAAGIFDVDLSSPTVVECRAGSGPNQNQHQIVATFPTSVTIGGVTLTSPDGGSGAATASAAGAVVTVNLTGVADQHNYVIALSNVDYGTSLATSVTIPVRFLRGDTNGDGVVNAGDAQQTRNRSGQTTDATNFRSDINTDGTCNAADSQSVRNASGHFVP